MNACSRVASLLMSLTVIAVGTAIAADAPRGVSPGALDRVVAIGGGCTTFSWQEVDGASSYEIVAYALNEGAAVGATLDAEKVSEVLYTRVPGGATSWTPALDDCFAPGGNYAWFVRAVLDEATGDATAWSAPMLFAVPATPSAVEVERALEVLLRYVETDAEADGRDRIGPDRREIADLARAAGAKAAGRSVQTGTAAIRGEQPDPSGETYGVVGTSASPDGAGLGAANTARGPDLVLDGSAAGAADAELNEAGIDRPSASPQTFAVGNSGGGGMTLQVDGLEVVTTATDQDTVGALSCAPDEIAKWDGSAWVCEPSVYTGALASLNCDAGEVAKWTGMWWVCAPDDDTIVWQTNAGKVYTLSFVGIGTVDPQNRLSVNGDGSPLFAASFRFNDNSFAHLASSQEGVYGEGFEAGVHGKYHYNESHGYLGRSGIGVEGVSTGYGVKGHGALAGMFGENDAGDSATIGFQDKGVQASGNLIGVLGSTSRDSSHGFFPYSYGVEGHVFLDNASGQSAAVRGSISGDLGAQGGFAYSGHFTGNVTGDGTYLGVYADYRSGASIDVAEFIHGVASPGDVVVADKKNAETVIPSTEPYDTAVVGIISTNPHMIMGLEVIKDVDGNFLEDVNAVKLAISGRVPVKVTGPVGIGDLLTTSSIPGHAMRCGDPSQCAGAVVGKALDVNIAGEGQIIALVALQ